MLWMNRSRALSNLSLGGVLFDAARRRIGKARLAIIGIIIEKESTTQGAIWKGPLFTIGVPLRFSAHTNGRYGKEGLQTGQPRNPGPAPIAETWKDALEALGARTVRSESEELGPPLSVLKVAQGVQKKSSGAAGASELNG
jgi:hypothetical protein